MAEECPPSEVPIIKEDNAPMDCETSEVQSIKADDSSSDKNALTLPISDSTSAAASSPVSDSEGAIVNLEDTGEKDGALTLPVSGATSAAASTPVSDSESAMNPEEVRGKEGALTLPVTTNATSAATSYSESAMSPGDLNVKTGALTLSVSGATTSAAASISDSGCATSPDDANVKAGALTTLPVSGAASSNLSESEGVTSPDDKPAKEVVADVDPACPTELGAAAPVSGSTDVAPEILSPEKVAEMMSPDNKEKGGLFKGVKTAIRTKVKQVWKKLSPKKPEKAALAASAQDESKEPETVEKKPYKVVTYVSPTRTGSLLVLNSTASDEVTLDTDLPTSGSEVFLPDEASTATCESSTHASRLPSLGSEDSPEHDPKESSGDRGDETTDDANPEKSS